MVGSFEAKPRRRGLRSSIGLGLSLLLLAGCGGKVAADQGDGAPSLASPPGTEAPYSYDPTKASPTPTDSVGVFSTSTPESTRSSQKGEDDAPSPTPSPTESSDAPKKGWLRACPAGQTLIGSLLLTPGDIATFGTQESSPTDTSVLVHDSSGSAVQPKTLFVIRKRPVQDGQGHFYDGGEAPTIVDMGAVGNGFNNYWTTNGLAFVPFLGESNPSVPAGDLGLQTCG